MPIIKTFQWVQEAPMAYTELISKTPTSVFLTDATYSLCPINNNDWLIDADSIELNLEKNRGIADKANARILWYSNFLFTKV